MQGINCSNQMFKSNIQILNWHFTLECNKGDICKNLKLEEGID